MIINISVIMTLPLSRSYLAPARRATAANREIIFAQIISVPPRREILLLIFLNKTVLIQDARDIF